MHSNIKVRTIVNIINVYNNYARQIAMDKHEVERCRKEDDKNGLMFAEIQLKKDRAKMSEFLDYFV